MKKKNPLIILTALSLFLTACNTGSSESSAGVTSATTENTAVTTELTSESTMQTTTTTEEADNITPISIDVNYLDRPNVLAKHYKPATVSALSATAMKLKPNSDLSNVYFGKDVKPSDLDKDFKKLLLKNGFALGYDLCYDLGYNLYYNNYGEFYELYENNRYWKQANYVTVDSLMHTYHLYFAHLLKKIEKEQFADQIKNISLQMLKTAEQHCEKLKGTEWEQAALTELAFFAVGAKLSDPSFTVPASVADVVQAEVETICGEGGIGFSAVLSGVKEDYSQYKPRGYYENDEVLQKYFRTMMWYGRMGFTQKSDLLGRTALLITTGMQGDVLKDWMEIYDVTSFFAGASDDIGYCELKPVADKIYGEGYTLDSLTGDDEKWTTFRAACKGLRLPAINSVPTNWTSLEEHKEAQIGFRFMGQRFSIDQACFTHLYEDSIGLPDALDFPASLGSDTALEILKQEGRTNERYNKKLSEVRQEIKNAPDSAWNASLSSAWIYTLNPLLEKKDASYPYFMQTDAWRRRALITFEGSYTELKHDTVLYAKQFMGEFGDPEVPDVPNNDDRGFVETEPLVFARLKALVEATSAGLDDYGMISKKDKQNMATLAELAGKLQTIAEKELKGILPTNQEFDLIRGYGGQLEHFYDEVKDSFYSEEDYSDMNSPAVIVDIATSASEGVLEVATGDPMCIHVIVGVDGKLRLVSGAVYSFYQFKSDTRMTDSEWHEKMIDYENPPVIPEWYEDL